MKEDSLRLFELEPSWHKILEEELKSPYISNLAAHVERERSLEIPIYPPRELVFNAFQKTPFNEVRVVIIGQDPYHGPGQAHGLCFSVPQGVAPPPSLQNIFKELTADIGIPAPKHGCLLKWAEQGVLLLNATLTVRQDQPLSHYGKGWEKFTDSVISKLCYRKEPIIFVLWGKHAQKKYNQLHLDSTSHHFILTAPHPSPLSAYQGFLGCRHFSQINELLTKQGMKTIDWSI